MGSQKAIKVLERLGRDVRGARLRRGMAVSDLAIRANTSVAESQTASLHGSPLWIAVGTRQVISVALRRHRAAAFQSPSMLPW